LSKHPLACGVMTKPDPAALHPMQRVIAAAVAEERPTLEAFLDDYRTAVTRKVRGVSEEDVRRRLVPSATTLGGIVTHLRWVELYWFQRTLAQIPDSELPPIPWDDPERHFPDRARGHRGRADHRLRPAMRAV
jgi:Protein of unknown function (DUF664)